jgi:hypothetical protein
MGNIIDYVVNAVKLFHPPISLVHNGNSIHGPLLVHTHIHFFSFTSQINYISNFGAINNFNDIAESASEREK